MLGAPLRIFVGVRENLAAGPVNGALEPSDNSTSCNMSRHSICECSPAS